MKLSCPFCPEEITPETTTCPSCNTTYDFDTLKFLRILVRESSKNDPDDRRDERRVLTTLRIRCSSPMEFVDNYLHDLSLGRAAVLSYLIGFSMSLLIIFVFVNL